MVDVKDVCNKHKGETAVFVGNGPSLSDTNLKNLSDQTTFATNQIDKIYNKTSWRPTYYCFIHSHLFGENSYIERNIINSESTFIDEENFNRISKDLYKSNTVYTVKKRVVKDRRLECYKNPNPPDVSELYWSDKIEEFIYLYNASIFPVFQLVNYMGFSDLYLVGCDLGIDTSWYPPFSEADDPAGKDASSIISYIKNADGSKIKSFINGVSYRFPLLFQMILSDSTHFYSDSGFSFVIGEDGRQRRAHRLGRNKLQQRDVSIYNATIDTDLEIHPIVDFDSVFDS